MIQRPKVPVVDSKRLELLEHDVTVYSEEV